MSNKDVEWFIEQLRRQFSDHSLEEAGVTLEFYFDAKNVLGAAVGVQGTDIPILAESGDRHHSRQREVLVECLFSAGWLGPVRMLAPHQAEFLILLNKNLIVGDEKDFQRRAEDYLARFDFVGGTAWAVEEISSHSLAQRTFKAIELTRLFWKKKISHWRADGLLPTDTLPTDFRTIVGLPIFRRIRALFDKHRPNNKRSNLADAVALTALAAEVKNFRNDSVRRLPLLLAPPLFVDIISDAGLTEEFEYSAGNQTYSVLCDTNYFIFRSILYPVDNVADGESVTELRGRLEQLRRKLERMISSGENSPEALVEVMAEHRSGRFDTDQIRNYSFFDQVWLPVAAAAQRRVTGSLLSIVQLMQSKEVQRAISSNLKELTSDLRYNAMQYRRARRLHQKLLPAVAKLESQIPAALLHERPLDVLGLVRFSFPPPARDELRRLFKKFGTSGKEGPLAKTAHDDVMRAMFRAVWAPREAEDATAIAVNAALLWVAKLYQELVHRLETRRALHFSLTAIYGAAALECGKPELATKAAEDLEDILSKSTKLETRGAISVTLSYLLYHLAVAGGFQPCWEQGRLRVSLEGVAQPQLVERAIEYARRAAGVTTLDPSLRVYALNLCVFYGVALPLKDRVRLRQLAVQLLQFKTQAVWQYRYEDTIARYFFLCSLEALSEPEMRRDLEFAERHVRLAAMEAPFDPRISQFESYLNIIRPVVESRFNEH